jgi:hypothetical protein
VLVVVAIGWFVVRSRTEAPAPAGAAKSGDAGAPAVARDSAVAKAKAPAAITVEPAGNAWTAGLSREAQVGLAAGDALSAEALDKARAIARGGEVPAEALDRELGAATPELRVRQAETIVWLEENLGALLDREGDTPAVRQLAKDADAVLAILGGRDAKDGAEKKRADEAQVDAPGAPAPSARSEKSPSEVSALKVTEARQTEAPIAGARRDQGASEAAAYVVTGPGVIARVKRVLADRGISFDQVWLKDEDPNLRRRTMEQAATDYRIIEASVPEAEVNDLVGDLESLDGIRLAPVGGGERSRSAIPETAFAKRPAADLQGPQGGGAAGRAGALAPRGGVPADSGPATAVSAAAQPKLLGMRKLRLVLISR